MDHIYLRFAWSYLEPEEGKFNWSVLDEMVEKWTAKGYGISIRITSKETGTKPIEQQYATPLWVKEAGCKGEYYRRHKEPGDASFPWEPVFNDPIYLDKLENFIKAFADRYDGQPWLRYVDIGSLGDWGEGHTSSGSNIRYDGESRLKHLKIHTQYFRKSQLIVSDDFIYGTPTKEESGSLFNYCLDNHISFRDDSIMVDYWARKHPATYSVAHTNLYEAVYRKHPTVLKCPAETEAGYRNPT